MNFLAFDLGAGSGRLYLASLSEGRLSLEEIVRVENGPVAIGDGLYWDIPAIWKSLFSGIRKAVSITGDNIASIGFDSFCNDFCMIGERGDLITQVRCYRDERTARHEKEMEDIMSYAELYRVNGNQRGLFNTLPQMHAMIRENGKWLLENSRYALFVSDLFSFLLTGKAFTEYTTASVTQMFDYSAGTWSSLVMEKFGIPASAFAPLIRPGETAGYTSEKVNRELHTAGFPVVAVCQHDTASAFLGASQGKDCAIISAGTWSVVGTETAAPIISDYGYLHNIANEGSLPGHHRILKNTMGTWIIQEIRRELAERGEKYSYRELDEEASRFIGSPCVADVDDQRFYSPGNMIEKVRAFCRENGVREPSDVGEIVYAVQAGLAMRYRSAIEKIEKLMGKHLNYVNIVGGGCESALACSLTADICGRVVYAGPADATVLGNVIVQMMAAGVISTVEEGRKIIRESFPVREYLPSVNSRTWDGAYKHFIKEREGA